MARAALTIGRLASAAGVNVQTVRFYQRRGLIAIPSRPPGGVRRYAPGTAARIRLIKRAQALGFSLSEVALLLRLARAGNGAETKALARKKLARVEKKMRDLATMRKVLRALIAECSSGSRRSGHPIIHALGAER